jgi:hypothetical protein
LEAGGRPSGTGRPSLPAPRNDPDRSPRGTDRADDERTREADDDRAARLRAAARAKQLAQAKPFEQVLDDAGHAPLVQQPSEATPPAEKPPAVLAGEPAAKAAKPANKSGRAAADDAVVAPPILPITTPDSAPGANAANSADGDAKPLKLRADALPLPDGAAAAPAVAEKTTSASPIQDPSADTGPAQALAIDTPVASATELAQAAVRETTGAIPALHAPDARAETPEPAAARAPLAPPPPPADSGRAGEILRQMRVQLSPEMHSATIQLSPPELGRISIRLRMNAGELRAVVRAEKRETLDALQRHVPELKSTLEQLGIQAREFDLQLGFEQRGSPQDPQQPRADGKTRGEPEQDSTASEQRLARTLTARVGGIDTYA